MKLLLILASMLSLGSVKALSVCTDELPCYERTLTFIADGPFILNTDVTEEEFLSYYAKAGLNRAEVIAIGRQALDFYFQQYGIDLRSLSDENLLSGNTNGPGGTLFFPTVAGDEYRYRLTTASVSGNTFSTAQFYNTPVADGGFFIQAGQEFQASGEYGGTIPANGLLVYGHYIIRPCDSPKLSCAGPEKCQDILGRDENGAITIQYNTLTYFFQTQIPIPFGVIDCVVRHPVWGEGRARGVAFEAIDLQTGSESSPSTRNVLTFPSTR